MVKLPDRSSREQPPFTVRRSTLAFSRHRRANLMYDFIMSRILPIRPPSVFSASTYSAPVTMPLANAYLSANLLKHEHQVSNIDALGVDINHIDVSYHPRVRYRGLSTSKILDRISTRPDGIGVSVMFSQD